MTLSHEEESLTAKVWLRLGDTLGTSFYTQFGKTPNESWQKVILRLTEKQLKRAFRRLVTERPRFFDLAAFVTLARGADSRENAAMYIPHERQIMPHTQEEYAEFAKTGMEKIRGVKHK